MSHEGGTHQRTELKRTESHALGEQNPLGSEAFAQAPPAYTGSSRSKACMSVGGRIIIRV